MKKNLILLGCLLSVAVAKAQSQNRVVYIPETQVCYLGSGIAVAQNGNTLTLSINNAVGVPATPQRIQMANDCTKGELINDETHQGTHILTCDTSVNVTCFCTGAK